MSTPDLAAQLEQYRLALEAQLTLLARLRAVAISQQTLANSANLQALQAAVDERDGLMAGIMAIEQQNEGARAELARERDVVRRLPAFVEIVTLHKQVTDTVAAVLQIDRDSIRALEQVMAARRMAAQALEHGEATLAAYSRSVAQPPSATLVNRRG